MNRSVGKRTRIPKYRRHSTRDLGFVEWRGARYYFKGPYNSEESVAEYREFLRVNVLVSDPVDEEPDTLPINGCLTIAELGYRHLLWAERYYGEKSQEFNHLYRCVQMLDNVASMRARDFGPLALKQVRALMVAGELPPRKDDRPTKRWSRRYINEQVNRIRRIFRWAVENELVPEHVLQSLKTVMPLRAGKTAAPETKKVQAVDWSQVELVLPFMTPIVADMVRLQGLTGMRSSEIVRMTPGQIDRSKNPWVYSPDHHKTKWRAQEKIIFLGPRAQKILRRYLDRPDDKALFTPAESIEWVREQQRSKRTRKKSPSQLVLRPKQYPKRPPGDRYTSHSYRRSVSYAARRARIALARQAAKLGEPAPEIVQWHPHQIRHSLAARVRGEFGLEAAKALLGNTIEATQIYSARDLELARSIASSIG